MKSNLQGTSETAENSQNNLRTSQNAYRASIGVDVPSKEAVNDLLGC